MFIDAHVHLRDFKQKYKETVKHGLGVAYDSGLDAVFDMPNTDPPIITRDLVLERLRLAKESNIPIFYGLFIGLIPDNEQIKKAIDIYREFKQVVGMKLYAGHSVGTLGIINKKSQYFIYNTLAKEGYDGVLAVHAEKESYIYKILWNPKLPITHCLARSEIAEVESIKDQLEIADQTSFKGKLHITHISSPKAVELVEKARSFGRDISCGICPHHFIYDSSSMSYKNGILMKMNPPLRNLNSKEKMFQYLSDGKIDWIETDHAPHSLEEKINAPFMSGIPGLPWWPLFEEYLRFKGFSDDKIEKLTFFNILKRFNLDLSRSKKNIKDHRKDYPFNPYHIIEKQLGWKE